MAPSLREWNTGWKPVTTILKNCWLLEQSPEQTGKFEPRMIADERRDNLRKSSQLAVLLSLVFTAPMSVKLKPQAITILVMEIQLATPKKSSTKPKKKEAP